MKEQKERPILFSTPMVQAILEGHKTQTRRIVKQKHLPFVENILNGFLDGEWNQRPLPYGTKGDRLWVRETWAYALYFGKHTGHYFYRATYKNSGSYDDIKGWKPSIFMPRSANRIMLEITNVRVERLKDISEADAKAEGVIAGCSNCGDPVDYDNCKCNSNKPEYIDSYIWLWESINGTGSWNLNPWVWVIEFRRL